MCDAIELIGLPLVDMLVDKDRRDRRDCKALGKGWGSTRKGTGWVGSSWVGNSWVGKDCSWVGKDCSRGRTMALGNSLARKKSRSTSVGSMDHTFLKEEANELKSKPLHFRLHFLTLAFLEIS